MAFNGWENAAPGEEFSVQEIAAHYGTIGPYSLLGAPSHSLWGRYPLMVQAVAFDGVKDLFEPGTRVRVFLRKNENGYTYTAFPEDMVDKEETLRPFLDTAEENAVRKSEPTADEPWTDMFCVRDYHMPYSDGLQAMEPPYTEEEMRSLYNKFAETFAEHEGVAIISGLYGTGAERFSAFCFGLACVDCNMPDGTRYYAKWDLVMLFFDLIGEEVQAVATIPPRFVNFYDAEKLKNFAQALAG